MISTGSGLASKGGKGIKRPFEEVEISDNENEESQSVTESIPDVEELEESDSEGKGFNVFY